MKTGNNAIKVSTSRKIFVALNTLFFILTVLICFYPLWYVFIQSLSSGDASVNALFLPVNFTLQNYTDILKMPEVFSAVGISVLRTVIGSAGTVLCCMLAGYIYSKENMPFRKFFYRYLIITMYVSGGLIPTYLVYKAYGLTNNFWVYIVPGLLGAYNVILVKTFVEQLPKSLEESATLDGASTMRIFFSIILPLSAPIAATLTIYATNGQWNAWFDNHLYNASTKELTTLQYLLYTYLMKTEQLQALLEQNTDIDERMVERLLTPRGIKMTVTMISTIPILCVYPFMQRYLIKGLLVGAVKG